MKKKYEMEKSDDGRDEVVRVCSFKKEWTKTKLEETFSKTREQLS